MYRGKLKLTRMYYKNLRFFFHSTELNNVLSYPVRLPEMCIYIYNENSARKIEKKTILVLSNGRKPLYMKNNSDI